MRPKVVRLRGFDKPCAEERELLDALGPFAAAPGLHYLIDLDTEAVIEPAFLFLVAKHGKDGAVTEANPLPSTASSRSSAFELAEWFRFLARVKRRWDRVTHDDIALYTHLKATGFSYHTGRVREPSTIGHKLSVVYGLYTWFNSIKVTDVRWDADIIRSAYGQGGEVREDCDLEIRPFAAEDLRKVLHALGPLPSELAKGSLRPTRDRLLFETGLLTGMRGWEICNLSAKAIKRLKTDLDRPDDTHELEIAAAKRRRGKRKKRWVALPNSLIHELQLYIAGERARAMDSLDHDRLFVNLQGNRLAGQPVKTGTIHRRTHAVMIKAGLAEDDEKILDGERVPYKRTLHSFHDTRHTYAVNLYILQKHAGDSAPWTTVQKMLGHSDWMTTEKYYLTSVGIFEPQVGVRLARYWEEA